MELIIDIDENLYKVVQNEVKGKVNVSNVWTAIANGTPYEERPQGEWVSKEEVLKIMCEKCPVYNCVSSCNSYRSIEKMSSVQSQRPKGGVE